MRILEVEDKIEEIDSSLNKNGTSQIFLRKKTGNLGHQEIWDTITK